MATRQPLTKEEQEAAANLSRIWAAKKEALGLTQAKAATMLGFNTQSSVSQFLRGDVPLNTDAVLGFARILGVLPGEIQPSLSTIFQTLLSPNTVSAPMGTRKIPVITLSQAGIWSAADAATPTTRIFMTDKHWSEQAFAVEVDGDSMAPLFERGDQLVVDPAVRPKPGDYVVARVGDAVDATFRRYRTIGMDGDGQEIIELQPLHPDYYPVRSDVIPITVIGKVVESKKFYK